MVEMPMTLSIAIAMVHDEMSECKAHFMCCLLAWVAQAKVRMACAERKRRFDADLGRL